MEEGNLDSAEFSIQLDDDDWFEGGSASFVMTGVFGEPSKRAERAQEKEREKKKGS